MPAFRARNVGVRAERTLADRIAGSRKALTAYERTELLSVSAISKTRRDSCLSRRHFPAILSGRNREMAERARRLGNIRLT